MTPSRAVARTVRRLSLAAAFLLLATPLAQAATLDLYGLRIGTEYKLGAKDTPDHQTGNWGSGVVAIGAPYAGDGRTWEFAALAPLPGVVALDPAGKVHAVVVVGGGAGEQGIAQVAWDLKAGTTVVASGGNKALQFVGEMITLTWDETPAVTTIDPAQGDLKFTVTVSQAFSIGMRIGLGPDPWTHVELPILGALPAAGNTTGNATGNNTAITTGTSTGSTTGSATSSGTASSTQTTAPAGGDGASTTTTSGNATAEEGKDAPALPAAFVLVGLVALALVTRRRLA